MFKYILLLSALLLASTAGWFSVFGISQLFSGAYIAAIIMATALEIGKLVSVSFIYRYWTHTHRLLRGYMLIGALTLSVITSLGVYAFLSSAYASTAVGYVAGQNDIQLVETQQNSLNTIIESNTTRFNQLQNYRAQQEVRLDSLVGRNGFVTQQRVVQQADIDIRELQNQTTELILRRDSLELIKVQKTNVLQAETKMGTFAYIAGILNTDLDIIVRWFILIIVLVFDPMSLALILAYNIARKTDMGEMATVIPVLPPTEPISTAPESLVTTNLSPTVSEEGPLQSEAETELQPEAEIERPKDDLSTVYYMMPGYNWSQDDRWKSDPNAKIYRQRMVIPRS